MMADNAVSQNSENGLIPSLPVAVDAMGGDFGPEVVVPGAVDAARNGVEVLLVGDPDRLGSDHGLPVVEASQVIPMNADPARAVRSMKDSSIMRAAEAVRNGQACAMWSAGSTGAAMAASLLRLGRIKGINRPAVAVPFPVLGGSPCTLLDCGANPDCQPEWLVQFAMMGAAYTRTRFGVDRPRIGMLTIGEEAGKGNALVKDACTLLEQPEWAKQSGAEYVGNVEGGDIMSGIADVIVCDGFTGNVTLKAIEGSLDIVFSNTRKAIAANEALAAVGEEIEGTIGPLFDEVYDSRATGAAMLLGTKEVSMISHGSSNVKTVSRAIGTAAEVARAGIIDDIREAVGAPARAN